MEQGRCLETCLGGGARNRLVSGWDNRARRKEIGNENWTKQVESKKLGTKLWTGIAGGIYKWQQLLLKWNMMLPVIYILTLLLKYPYY